jgi:hypothetical protein
MDNEEITIASEVEKLVPQSQVNELIGGAKAAAADKARRETEAQYQNKITELEDRIKASAPVDEDAIIAKLEARRAEQEEQKQKAIEVAEIDKQTDEIRIKYKSKLDAAHDISPDFDGLMRTFPHGNHPALVMGTVDMPNTAQVMLELARNPSRAFTLQKMSHDNWDGCMMELKKISEALLVKESVGKGKVSAPLSRLEPGVKMGLSNNGKRSFSELRKDKNLRL